MVFKTNYRVHDFKNLAIDIAKNSNIKVLVSDAIEFLIEKVKKKKLEKKVLKGLINRCKYFIKNNDDNIRWTETFIKYGRQISAINQTNLRQWDLLQAKAHEKEMKQLVKFGAFIIFGTNIEVCFCIFLTTLTEIPILIGHNIVLDLKRLTRNVIAVCCCLLQL